MTDRLIICLLTYKRLNFARKTLESLLINFRCREVDWGVHIADDGSGTEYVKDLLELTRAYIHEPDRVSVSASERNGYGGNYNHAMQVIHNLGNVKYVLPLEDDWELIREFNADPIIQTLANTSLGINCVRLGYVGYTQPLLAKFINNGGAHYLVLDPDSPEPHVFAGHPRIETVAWEREVGPWTERLGAGSTEFEVAHREAARKGIAWPISLIPPEGNLFAHIGAESAEDVS